MPLNKAYQNDYDYLLSLQDHNGARLWATDDNRIGKGSPFSTRDCALMLVELGIDQSDDIGRATGELMLRNWREDGKIRVAPKGTIYPCHTITIARALSHLGFAEDERLQQSYAHLVEIQDRDGGWKCNKYSGGRGPETEFSNPGPSLEALDALRFSSYFRQDRQRLDATVEFLLRHWEIKYPIGPCHFGIGSLFKRLEFPFLRYNLFYYCYVLSFFPSARKDQRFREAFELLTGKLEEGRPVIEHSHRRLQKLEFCRIGQTTDAATRRMREIMENLAA